MLHMPLSRTSLYTALVLDVLSITVEIQWEMAGNVPAIFFLSFGSTAAWREYVYDTVLLLSFRKVGICWHFVGLHRLQQVLAYSLCLV